MELINRTQSESLFLAQDVTRIHYSQTVFSLLWFRTSCFSTFLVLFELKVKMCRLNSNPKRGGAAKEQHVESTHFHPRLSIRLFFLN